MNPNIKAALCVAATFVATPAFAQYYQQQSPYQQGGQQYQQQPGEGEQGATEHDPEVIHGSHTGALRETDNGSPHYVQLGDRSIVVTYTGKLFAQTPQPFARERKAANSHGCAKTGRR